jgi:glucosamine-phosphate N-acetyltransferase
MLFFLETVMDTSTQQLLGAAQPTPSFTTPLQIREMTVADLSRGFLESLASLSDVGLRPVEAVEFFHERLRAGVRTYVACEGEEVIGTASLLLERKYLHRGGLVGHIEDVAVRRDLQRQGVGTALMRHAVGEARRLGCYKVILNCFEDRVGFYARLGFHEHDCGLRFDCR